MERDNEEVGVCLPSRETDDHVENEINETVEVGKLIGVNLDNFRSEIRGIISEEVLIMNQQIAMEFKNVPQPKQQCEMKEPTRNWLDLPSELTANILYRIGVIDILQSAQKVCTAWRKICKDPAMWRVVYMGSFSDLRADIGLDVACKHVVDRSQGQLVDITIVEFGYGDILLYIANRSSQLKRLTIACCEDYMEDAWSESLKKFPLLEELSLYATEISTVAIETAGRYCSMLKTLKVNQEDWRIWYDDSDGDPDKDICDDWMAIAIGENLHELRHLELIGSPMSNEGLEMILDGCQHLESLDLRACLFIDLNGDLGKRCAAQIKCLKLPNDSLEGCPYIYQNHGMTCEYDESDEEYDDESDEEYDDASDIGFDDEFDDEFYDEFDIESDDEY